MTMPLKVNFSSQEASSAPREIPPSGEYVVAIVEGELKEVKPGKKNSGKPYWNLQFVIQSGNFDGTRLYASVMLFDGALYSLSQLLKALGYDINAGDFVLPTLDDILGKTLVVRGFKQPPKTDETGRELPERFEIKNYKPNNGATKAQANQSLLP